MQNSRSFLFLDHLMLQADLPGTSLNYGPEDDFVGWNYDAMYAALMSGVKRQEFFDNCKAEFNDIQNRLPDASERNNATEIYMFMTDAIRTAGLKCFANRQTQCYPEFIQKLKNKQNTTLKERREVREELYSVLGYTSRVRTLIFFLGYADVWTALSAEFKGFCRGLLLFWKSQTSLDASTKKAQEAQKNV